ncbi:DUF6565 domain-containing protein [Membranihabitans maritimus]|uniref:DUF6565 domain-containing protein n=1 Tax=Membranihabitans maritimus TaxID=2904244 RepID=UPI001F187350|nr:DUF6565 domain-containing protein [Membranihabitans maritimus]
MRKIFGKNTLFTLLILSILCSCESLQCGSNPEQLIGKMESLVETVKEKRKESNSNDWETWDHKFVNYYENCYNALKDEMDTGQKGKFVGLSIKYVTIRLGNEIKSMFADKNEEKSEFSEVLKNIAEELKKGNN